MVHGKVTLSSGKEADYYVDLRRATLHHEASRLIGALLRELTADWDFAAVGGLTLGADPVATSVLHAAAAAGDRVDAFVVRKAGKAHGLQQRIEGPSIAGRRVVVLEDTTTTGGSPLEAVSAVREAGCVVIGKTTTPEFAWKGVTDNTLTGITRNPHDPALTPGGSSGGAASAVAAGLGQLALGTDGGGSVRIPAAFCAIVALKPDTSLTLDEVREFAKDSLAPYKLPLALHLVDALPRNPAGKVLKFKLREQV